MLRIRSTAAMAGLVSAVALGVGVISGPAAAGRAGPSHSIPVPPVDARPTARISRAISEIAVIRHYGQPTNASGYSAIVVTGARQAWAFGGTNPGGPSLPVAERWNGTTATPATLPPGLRGFISDASAPSARDVWAASQYGGYVLHWNGRAWHVARRWAGGQITGLTAISSTDVWTFGTTATGSRGSGTWQFNGTSWHSVAGLAGSIYRASAVSRRDIWAIAAGPAADSILRYEDGTWHLVRTGRALAGVQPHDILAISERDVWVLGNQVGRSGVVRLVLAHWNGARWARLMSGEHAWAGRLAPGPRGTVLVTATPANASATGLILEASAHGWQLAISIQSGLGSGVSDVATIRGTRWYWATGGILTRLGGDAAIWTGPLARAVHHADDDV
jgi:hypothetical protein